MRCRECAAEIAVTALVCSRCGAPIVGPPPVVADTVVGTVSDAGRKAVAASVAGQPREPYVSGSGEKLPAELRLVLAGYVGVACGLFFGALVCAAAAVFPYFFDDNVFSFVDYVDPDDGVVAELIGTAIYTGSFLAVGACIWALWRALKRLKASIQFSKLLRRPGDPHTATVMASKRGGRTLILDVPWDGTGRGYQPQSEVRLALWTKAEILMPGERVTVHGGPGGESQPPRRDRSVSVGPPEEPSQPLLISSSQRGRAFLGTMQGRSTVQPGPVTPLDEKVSGASLVDWAAWAASTTFSSTGLGFGYDKREVDAFRSAVRDTFLGLSGPAVKSDDLRGKQFSSHRPGYDKKEVAAFLAEASLRLAAMESTDRPTGLLVSGALLAGWAEWADQTTFSKARWRLGYMPIPVDAFREEIRDTFLGATRSPVRADDVRGTQFYSADAPPSNGYDKKQVDAFLDAAGIRLAAMERREIPGVLGMSTDRPDRPLVSDAILAGWAQWADSTRFSTSRRRQGYDTAEVDAFREEVRDTFLGATKPADEWPTVQDLMPWSSPSKPPARSDDLRGKQFSTHRPGYDKKQVDAFLDKAEPRLATMRATDKGAT